MDNSIQLSIETLERILETSKDLHQKHSNTIPIIRISKTAERQYPDHQDKFEYSILLKSTDPQKTNDGE
jgi:hypothetical protein